MSVTAETLRRTPLHDRHVAAGARLVPFAGWEMPVQYEGVRQEHLAVREGGSAMYLEALRSYPNYTGESRIGGSLPAGRHAV